MHSTLLAFDIGTSGLKASLVDENLNIIRNVTTTYPTHHYPDGGCEQEAADWWMSAVRAMMMLRELAPEYVKRVDAIGVSGHMLGCLPMDSEGQTLRPAMIHADTRALAISNALRARYGRDYFYEICGNVLSPASTLCKTLWLKEHEPELYARTVRILQSKDYLVYRLTGHMDTTDMSDASHGLLMNLRTRQYDLDMFRNVGVDELRARGLPVRRSGGLPRPAGRHPGVRRRRRRRVRQHRRGRGEARRFLPQSRHHRVDRRADGRAVHRPAAPRLPHLHARRPRLQRLRHRAVRGAVGLVGDGAV